MARICIINARIGTDPEMRPVGDSSVLQFRIAESKKRGDQELTSWYTVNIWDRYGQSLEAHCIKGAKISVEGELVLREFEDRNTGQKRISAEVRAETVNVPWNEQADEQSPHQKAKANGYQQQPEDDIPF